MSRERTLTIPITAHVRLQDVEHLEAKAREHGISRAAYVKELIRADAEKEAPVSVQP